MCGLIDLSCGMTRLRRGPKKYDAALRKNSNALFDWDSDGRVAASGGLRWIWIGPGHHESAGAHRVDNRVADHRQPRRRRDVDLEFHRRHVLQCFGWLDRRNGN